MRVIMVLGREECKKKYLKGQWPRFPQISERPQTTDSKHTCVHLLQLTSQAGEAARYHAPRPKSTEFLYLSNEHSEQKIKKPIPFIIAAKRIKSLRITAAPEVRGHVLASPAWLAAHAVLLGNGSSPQK